MGTALGGAHAPPPPPPPAFRRGSAAVRFVLEDGSVVEAPPDPALDRVVENLLPPRKP
jgi:hypothetical protein